MIKSAFILVFAVACIASPITTALAPAASPPTPVVCEPTDCLKQWERSQVWIARHGQLKIQTATEVQIQTERPSSFSRFYGFVATREPAEQGRYRIAMEPQCSFTHCEPSASDVQRAFYHYITTGVDLLEGIKGLGTATSIR